VVRIWAEQALLPEGWAEAVAVTLEGDRIATVTPDAPAAPNDTRVAVLLPAPANLHSHAFQRAMAGMTERRGPDPRDSFWTWRQLMFRFLDRLTPEDVQAIAALVQMEMLEAGYAASVEFHYLHHAPGGRPYADLAEMAGRIAAAAAGERHRAHAAAGALRGRRLRRAAARTRPDPLRQRPRPLRAPRRGVGRPSRGAARRYRARHRAAFAARGDARRALACAALRRDAPIHMHLAEQEAEVAEVLAHRGARPVEWLLDHAAVDERWCLIHCTQMQPHETRALAASGAVAGLCPITESSLGDGIFDGVAFTQAGGRWGIGSDSNIRVALGEELRTLEYSQRLRDRSRAALARPDRSTGRVLVETAARGGAQAAGRAAGAIAAGRLADLLALDTAGLDLAGRRGDDLLDAWIFAGGDRAVAEVWSAGRHLVSGGRHCRRDAILNAARPVFARLRAS
jgi:formimidoylglutamate deiminase